MGAFSDMNWWAFNTALTVITDKLSLENHTFCGVDVSAQKGPLEKQRFLKTSSVSSIEQRLQLCNPDARVSLAADRIADLLAKYAHSFQGIATADYARFGRCFWEFSDLPRGWEFQQSTVNTATAYGGREHIFLWELGTGALAKSPQARVQGLAALHKQGVAVSQMNRLPATLYCGNYFDNNTAVLIPNDLSHLTAVWAYCSSEEFYTNVRNIDGAVKVTNATLLKIPFDLERWQSVAEDQWPSGLPEPYSDDPTQWLFEGDPAESTAPLQAAVARLLGYQWPQRRRMVFLVLPYQTEFSPSHRSLGKSLLPKGCVECWLSPMRKIGRQSNRQSCYAMSASQKRASTRGSATASSSNTASCSIIGPSSGISGMVVGMGSQP